MALTPWKCLISSELWVDFKCQVYGVDSEGCWVLEEGARVGFRKASSRNWLNDGFE